MQSELSLLLVGCGKMGSALFHGWKSSGISRIEVIDPQSTGAHADLASIPTAFTPHIIIFAVKPQQLQDILPGYKKRFGSDPLYLSIAAGKTTDFFRKHLGGDIRIVRAMPNTPALIGKGMTVLCADHALSHADKEMATWLMQAVGHTQWMEESKMDAVTALSGSGPAYVFLFLEALTKAGIASGLSEAAAKKLTFETVASSCALAQASDDSVEQLRKNVTSPGGTTEAALHVLMKSDAFSKLIHEAVSAATKRSKELSQ